MTNKCKYVFCFFTIAFFLASGSVLSAQEGDLFNLRETGVKEESSAVKKEPDSDILADEELESGNIETDDSLASFQNEGVSGTEDKEGFNIGADRRKQLISVNFENVDIRDVIQILADKAQINMVVNPGVTANVNLQLNNVSWDKALKVILMTYNLTYKEDEGLVRIMTLEQMQKEDEKIPLSTKIVKLDFARAGTIKSNFENMLSSRGRIDVNARTNSLIVTDLPEYIKDIEEIAFKLDTRTPQVMIEALLADVKIDSDDELGIEWQLGWPDAKEGANSAFRYQRTAQQSLGGLTATGGLFNFGTTILENKDLDATIAFLQSQDKVNILAHPKILTLDNLAAKIELTEEIPYQQQTETTEGGAVVSTSFKNAGINLQVTPHITTKDNYVFLDINVSQSFQSATTPDGQPQIDRRAAQTNLLVKNRETAVIGGLRKKSDTFSVTKLPMLGDIPFFGALFRKRREDITDTDLMIFVTPTLMEEFILSEKEQSRLDLFEEETEDWVGKFERIKKRKEKEKKKKGITVSAEHIYLRPPELKDK